MSPTPICGKRIGRRTTEETSLRHTEDDDLSRRLLTFGGDASHFGEDGGDEPEIGFVEVGAPVRTAEYRLRVTRELLPKHVDQESQPLQHHAKDTARYSLGRLALSRWAGWSAGQVGRHVKCWRRERNGAFSLRREGSTRTNHLQKPPIS